MNRRDEEKAKEILDRLTYDGVEQIFPDKPWHSCEDLTSKQVRGFIMDISTEIVQWKESQMIEKFILFLHKECYDTRLLHWKDEVVREKIQQYVNMEDD